ncbi:MAG: TOMM precursor leader peptide-binding protein, partial [Vulcanimicrobiaceae bacterium]
MFWELDATRIRVGPLLDADSEGCLSCLSFWVNHNRPDPEIWRTLPPIDSQSVAKFPWPSVLYTMIESLSMAYLTDKPGRAFMDIDVTTLRVSSHRYLSAPNCQDCTPCPDDDRSFSLSRFS